MLATFAVKSAVKFSPLAAFGPSVGRVIGSRTDREKGPVNGRPFKSHFTLHCFTTTTAAVSFLQRHRKGVLGRIEAHAQHDLHEHGADDQSSHQAGRQDPRPSLPANAQTTPVTRGPAQPRSRRHLMPADVSERRHVQTDQA